MMANYCKRVFESLFDTFFCLKVNKNQPPDTHDRRFFITTQYLLKKQVERW